MARIKKEDKPGKRRKAAPTLVHEIANHVELEEVSLHDCEVVKTQDYGERKLDNIGLDFSGEVSKLDVKKYQFMATIDFRLRAQEKKGKELFHINSSFDLSYKTMPDESFSKADLEEFARVNGVFNAWPYFRELVQSMTIRIGYPPVTVPLLRFPKS